MLMSEDYDRVFLTEGQSIRIKEGNIAESQSIEQLNTSRSAYEHIKIGRASCRERV